MIITHKLQPMDLTHKQNTIRVDVVQDDKYSRDVEFTLTENGVAWQIPDGTTAVVRYKKPDGTGGNYDTLPDGSTAYQINGNVLTVSLAPQVCTVPGPVQLSVGLIKGNAEINTFSVNIIVQHNPGSTYQSEDYIKLSGAVPNSGWTPNMYLGTDAQGNVVAKEGTSGGGAGIVIDSTLTQSGQAADAKATGDAIRSLSEEIANLQTSGLTTAQVNALDGMFKVCAFTKDNVSAEYTAFKTAFGIADSGGETEVTLSSISVTYSGGDVAVGTALSDLTGIVVTATYSDGSTETVTGYTLSGEIVEGDNTISVTYNGKTATFTVTGTVENERVEHIVSGQTFPVTLTWSPVAFDVTPALATFVSGDATIYYDVEIDVESISSENAYIAVSAGGGAFVRNGIDYAGQTGTLKMTGEIWHQSMSDASQIKISCNKGTETSNQTAVITGVRIYER